MNETAGTRPPLTVLVFGATGAAGGSVLGVCLASPLVGTVRTIARRPVAKSATKLEPIVHDDVVGTTVCWRPAYIDGEQSDNAPLLLTITRSVFRLLKPFRSMYVAGEDIGLAMLQATLDGTRGRIIENAELQSLADQARLAGTLDQR